MPKKYTPLKGNNTMSLNLDEEVIHLSTDFSLLKTNESSAKEYNGSIWNIDSPVNQLYWASRTRSIFISFYFHQSPRVSCSAIKVAAHLQGRDNCRVKEQPKHDIQYEYNNNILLIVMSDNNFLKIYLRLTNGTGEKVSVNPLLTSKMLYNWVTQIFTLPDKSFDLVVRGVRIIDTCEITLQDLNVESDSIVHIQKKKH